MAPEANRVDILETINSSLEANSRPKTVVDIDATVDAMLDRMLDGPDDSHDRLKRAFAFNATTDRLEREKQEQERYEWMCGYTDLEPFNEFFVRAALVTAVAGAALAATGIKIAHKFFRRT